MQDGIDFINGLAAHPNTARYLATKLYRFFVTEFGAVNVTFVDRVAAVMPATTAQPGCRRLVQAPSSRNSMLPLAMESTMPCAMVARSAAESCEVFRTTARIEPPTESPFG